MVPVNSLRLPCFALLISIDSGKSGTCTLPDVCHGLRP